MSMSTGDKIKKIRKTKGITQKKLGELAGIAEPTIRKYENGQLNPKKETLQKIASALDISFECLLTDWMSTFPAKDKVYEVEDAEKRLSNMVEYIPPEKFINLVDMLENIDPIDFNDVLDYGQFKIQKRNKTEK